MSIQPSDETTTTTPAISLAFRGGRGIDDCDRSTFVDVLRGALLDSPRAREFFAFRGIEALDLKLPMEQHEGPYVTAIELEQPVRRSQGIGL